MNRIKEVLEQKWYSQTWLSEQLDKSYNIFNEYYNNRSQPSLGVVIKIAKTFKVDVKDLINSNIPS